MKAYKFCDCSIREFIFSFALLNFIVLAFFINFHLVKFEEILRIDQNKLLYTSSDKDVSFLQKKVDDVYLFSAPLAGASVLRDFFNFDANLFVHEVNSSEALLDGRNCNLEREKKLECKSKNRLYHVTFNETVSNILSNPGRLVYMVVNPRQYALYHIKKKELSNFDDVLPLVFAYCDKIQASFDFFYDFNGRKWVRIIRLEDLLANELGVAQDLYKFAGYKWRGVNAQELQKWAEKYQLEPNEWRTMLPFDLVDTIDSYW
jgi:hypothetical protein